MELYGDDIFNSDFSKLNAEELIAEREQFKEALLGLGENPPGKSQQLTAFSEAALEFLDSPELCPPFSELVNDFLKSRHTDKHHYKVQLFWRAFQNELLDRIEPNYPADYYDKSVWQQSFVDLLSDETAASYLEENLAIRNIQSNLPERYAGLKITLSLFKRLGTLPTRMSLIDAGCSAGLGQIQIEQNIPFLNVHSKYKPMVFRNVIKRLLAEHIELSANVGFDNTIIERRNKADDKVLLGSALRWIESNSYYPSELASKTKIERRKELYAKSRSFEVISANIIDTRENLLRELGSQTPRKQYDVASALTMLYELPAASRDLAADNLGALSKHLVFVQDFAEVSPQDPSRLEFYDDIYANDSRYNAFVRLKRDQEGRWNKLLTWDSGRCRTLTPSAYLLDLCAKIAPDVLKLNQTNVG